MNTQQLSPSFEPGAALEDRFGAKVAARLSVGNAELPHDISERLRVTRMQAMGHRKVAPRLHAAPVVLAGGSVAALGGGWTWWARVGSVVPLVALVAGLIIINTLQDDHRATEAAEVDSALLASDLPTAAYTDPGFLQFLKTGDNAATH